MFDSLSNRLGDVFRLRGRGALTETDVRAAMREVRIALLEADVARPWCAASSTRSPNLRSVPECPALGHAGAAGRQDRQRRADRNARLRSCRTVPSRRPPLS